jgi:hypothetical protein
LETRGSARKRRAARQRHQVQGPLRRRARLRPAEGQDGPLHPHHRHRPRRGEDPPSQHRLQHGAARPSRSLRRRMTRQAAAQGGGAVPARKIYRRRPQAPNPSSRCAAPISKRVNRTAHLLFLKIPTASGQPGFLTSSINATQRGRPATSDTTIARPWRINITMRREAAKSQQGLASSSGSFEISASSLSAIGG